MTRRSTRTESGVSFPVSRNSNYKCSQAGRRLACSSRGRSWFLGLELTVEEKLQAVSQRGRQGPLHVGLGRAG